MKKYNIKISCFVTDDSKSLKGALRLVWPDTRQLLCQFHVAAAAWNWLFVPCHKVTLKGRIKCINYFRKIMYSPTKESCKKAYQDALLALSSFAEFLKYLSQCFTRKHEWCFAFRKDVLNRSHNTNNLAETNFRLIKDVILGRLKAPNSVSLLSFICFEFDEYYCSRLTDVAFGRGQNKNKLYKVVSDRAQPIIDKYKTDFKLIEEDIYSVPCGWK